MIRNLVLTFILFSSASYATEIQRVGVFQVLDKSWFMVGVSGEMTAPSRLELRVMDGGISAKRFRKLWLDTIAIAPVSSGVNQAELTAEMERWFDMIQGPLREHDRIVLEQHGGLTHISINLKEHGCVTGPLVSALVAAMTHRISISTNLRTGLTGELPEPEARSLLRNFERSTPSLSRIAETARWLRPLANHIVSIAE